MYAQIDVELSPVDLHSGMYGGTVQNPANALAMIIAALKGPDGRIRVPGFYDDVEPLTRRTARALAALPFDEEAYREAIPVTELVGEAGFTVLENKGSRPTLDVNGMWSGFVGEGAKTIIPAHAHAKLSTRLVAHQDPKKIFEGLERFVAEVAPPGVTVDHDVHPRRRSEPHPHRPSGDPRRGTGDQGGLRRRPGLHPRGRLDPRHGRLQPSSSCRSCSSASRSPTCNAHAPNEWLELDNFERGTRVIVRLWDELARRLEALIEARRPRIDPRPGPSGG